MRKLLVLILVCVTVALADKRDGNLFKLFPLPQTLSSFYADKSDALHLASLVRTVAAQADAAKAERLTAALDAAQDISKTGEAATNFSVFHNYDAEAVVIYGKGKIEALRYLLKDEQYTPISLAHSGKGIIAVWVIHHKDTSLGSYKQLIVTTIVSPKGMGHTLGVSYEPGNDASMLFAAFGKLPEHARHFVLHSTFTTDEAKIFGSQIKSFPSELGLASFGAETTVEGKNVLRFDFYDANHNLVIAGSIPQDNTWTSYFKMGYKIFRAIGLSGILDLWNAPFVTAKFVSSIANNVQPKWNTMHMSMNQQFNDIAPSDVQLGDKNQIGRRLRDLDFEASMVSRMPNLQYAMMIPKDQTEDNEYVRSPFV